jgi:hypothetical protein
MKRIFLAFAGLAFTAALHAQTTGSTKTSTSPVSFGLRAGVNFQNLNGKDADGDDLDNKLATFFNAGINVELPIAPDFYIQPGVVYTMKGAKADNENFKAKISYLDVPVNFVYKPMLGSGKLILGVGPYIGFGLGGNISYDNNNISVKKDIEFKNETSTADYAASGGAMVKRIDAGGNLLFGYEFANKLSVQLNAQLGMINIMPKLSDAPDADGSLKHTGFGVSLGYRF